MPKNIFFLIKLIILIPLFISNLYAEELTIIPIKKPILDKIVEQQKITQGVIRPKSKPIKKKEVQKLSQEIIKPQSKPIKQKNEIETKIVKKKVEKIEEIQSELVKKKVDKIGFLIPKSKPLVFKKTSTTRKTKSKFYSQKDFDIAKKSIHAIEKRKWTSALTLSKKASDKSIYNFIQWRYLLTTGNQASFYDYLAFIKNNENYPRINRIRYLAEHKLSTDKISPKKIIDWFDSSEPLSGFGKLILGESFIKTGDIEKGTSLIKDGWITADFHTYQFFETWTDFAAYEEANIGGPMDEAGKDFWSVLEGHDDEILIFIGGYNSEAKVFGYAK